MFGAIFCNSPGVVLIGNVESSVHDINVVHSPFCEGSHAPAGVGDNRWVIVAANKVESDASEVTSDAIITHYA